MMYTYIVDYAIKMPFYLAWSMFFLFISTVNILLRNRSKLLDPRTFLTVMIFYATASIFVLFFVQIPLEVVSFIFFGKKFVDLFLPTSVNIVIKYAVNSMISTAIYVFFLIRTASIGMDILSRLPLIRRDIAEDILSYVRGGLINKVKTSLFLIVVGLFISFVLNLLS